MTSVRGHPQLCPLLASDLGQWLCCRPHPHSSLITGTEDSPWEGVRLGGAALLRTRGGGGWGISVTALAPCH